jgi:hypothetical protein
MDRLLIVPSCNMCGSFSGNTSIFATWANVGVIPVVVLPESHSVHALMPPTFTNVARHSFSSLPSTGHVRAVLDARITAFRTFTALFFCPSLSMAFIMPSGFITLSVMGARNSVSVSRS